MKLHFKPILQSGWSKLEGWAWICTVPLREIWTSPAWPQGAMGDKHKIPIPEWEHLDKRHSAALVVMLFLLTLSQFRLKSICRRKLSSTRIQQYTADPSFICTHGIRRPQVAVSQSVLSSRHIYIFQMSPLFICIRASAVPSGCCAAHNGLCSCLPLSHLSLQHKSAVCDSPTGYWQKEDGQAHLLWSCKTKYSLGFAYCDFCHLGGWVGHSLHDLKGHREYTKLSAFLLNPYC